MITTDLSSSSIANTATTETLTHIVHVKTLPYRRIAGFGYRLAMFANAHPDVRFSWDEAEYVDPDNRDDDDPEIDDVTIFEADPDWSTFLVSFEDKAGYDAYETWDTARGC
jgi:hypothetical protein